MAAVRVDVEKGPAREFEYRRRAPQDTAARKRQRMEAAVRGLPQLKEWDPTQLPHGFFVVLEGKRRTGKSTFAKWLLQWYQKRFSLAWVMTHTKANGYWQGIVGDSFVFDGYRADAVARAIARNDKIIARHGPDTPATLAAASTLIIFDDCITKEIYHDEMFVRLAVEGRHHCISVIFITQDPKTVSPKVRDNCDVAVVFNQKTYRNKESMWHDFMNDVDKETALALLARHAIDHNALVCVQTNLDGVIAKNFFASTGDKTQLQDPHYMLGGPEQVAIIRREREEARLKKLRAQLEDKADKRPPREKTEAGGEAGEFTVDKILSGFQ